MILNYLEPRNGPIVSFQLSLSLLPVGPNAIYVTDSDSISLIANSPIVLL